MSDTASNASNASTHSQEVQDILDYLKGLNDKQLKTFFTKATRYDKVVKERTFLRTNNTSLLARKNELDDELEQTKALLAEQTESFQALQAENRDLKTALEAEKNKGIPTKTGKLMDFSKDELTTFVPKEDLATWALNPMEERTIRLKAPKKTSKQKNKNNQEINHNKVFPNQGWFNSQVANCYKSGIWFNPEGAPTAEHTGWKKSGMKLCAYLRKTYPELNHHKNPETAYNTPEATIEAIERLIPTITGYTLYGIDPEEE